MKSIPKKYLVPIVISCIMLAAGAIGVFAITSSGLQFESEDYNAWFYMNHLQIHLLENGRDVCGGHNTLDGDSKVSGDLVQYMGYESKDGKDYLGSVEPGMLYREEIAARNGQDIPVYVRLSVRKYWVIANEDGTAGDKAPELSPEKIHLTFGDKDYNTDSWFINEKESTDEQKTYYYKTQLAANADTEPLFDSLVVDNSLVRKEETSRETDPETGVTTIKYKYTYDGYAFVIKADVQAIQTHNAEDAIHSQWGVYDIAEDGEQLKLK